MTLGEEVELKNSLEGKPGWMLCLRASLQKHGEQLHRLVGLALELARLSHLVRALVILLWVTPHNKRVEVC